MMENLEDKIYICASCDFNYRVVDEHGLMDYCAIMEWYEDNMRKLKSCPEYRVNNIYE